MKRTKILYWIFTVLTSALMLMSAFSSFGNPQSIEMINKHMGYPAYVLPFLGVSKILGVIALLIPGFPRIKEWAYAAFTLDLILASYSFFALGDPIAQWGIIMLISFILVIGSYVFYHKMRKDAAVTVA